MCLYRPIAGSAALPSQGAKPVTVEDVQKVRAAVGLMLAHGSYARASRLSLPLSHAPAPCAGPRSR